MTKSERILKLNNGTRTTRQIAVIVGTSTTYVRVVTQQRRGHPSTADKNYRKSPLGKLWRQRQAAADAERRRAQRQGLSKTAICKAAKDAYAAKAAEQGILAHPNE